MIRFVCLIVCLGVISGCYSLSKEDKRLYFSKNVQGTVGQHIEDLKHSPTEGFIGGRLPEEIIKLENDNLLYVYDYWKAPIFVRDGACIVSLEFDSEMMVVVKASSVGKGCSLAY